MANTYVLISSNTLSSSAASVTFSSIPSTYTDLAVRVSARSDGAAEFETVRITFNGSTASNYSVTYLRGNGAGASSSNASSSTYIPFNRAIDDGAATTNTFGSLEIYIPSYLSSTNKPISSTTAQEMNSTTAYIHANAGLWSNTSAISSIKLEVSGVNFVSGSSFYLYGIKNS